MKALFDTHPPQRGLRSTHAENRCLRGSVAIPLSARFSVKSPGQAHPDLGAVTDEGKEAEDWRKPLLRIFYRYEVSSPESAQATLSFTQSNSLKEQCHLWETHTRLSP